MEFPLGRLPVTDKQKMTIPPVSEDLLKLIESFRQSAGHLTAIERRSYRKCHFSTTVHGLRFTKLDDFSSCGWDSRLAAGEPPSGLPGCRGRLK